VFTDERVKYCNRKSGNLGRRLHGVDCFHPLVLFVEYTSISIMITGCVVRTSQDSLAIKKFFARRKARSTCALFSGRTTFFLCKCENYFENIFRLLMAFRGPGSVVGIATGYRLDSPGIESQWGRGFPHLSRPALGPTQPPVKWVPVFSRG
jgi:hypothetical protein